MPALVLLWWKRQLFASLLHSDLVTLVLDHLCLLAGPDRLPSLKPNQLGTEEHYGEEKRQMQRPYANSAYVWRSAVILSYFFFKVTGI